MMGQSAWVDGWLTQFVLLLAAVVALWFGMGHQSAIYLVGSMVIGVVRQIERTRRKRDAVGDAPPPGSKV